MMDDGFVVQVQTIFQIFAPESILGLLQCVRDPSCIFVCSVPEKLKISISIERIKKKLATHHNTKNQNLKQ